MIRGLGLLLIAVLAAAYAATDARGRVRSGRGTVAANYRGRRVPVALGVSLVVAILVPGMALLVVLLVGGDGGPGQAGRVAVLLVSSAGVFLAGVYDDVNPGPARGLVGHFREMRRGRMTSGLVKVVAGLAAGGVAAAVLGAEGWMLVIGILMVAGATNTWNLLDVVPGRALKAFLPVAVLTTVAGWNTEFGYLGASAVGAAVALLPLDLKEQGMLGDAGANLLGFVTGVGLLATLPTWGLGMALGAVLLVHLVSETVTLSLVIRTVPPLRWLDSLGRRRILRPDRDL